MCGAKRGQEIQRCRTKYNKNGSRAVSVCMCVSLSVCVRVFAGLITITRPRTSLDGLLNVSYGLAIGWYFLSASVCLSLFSLSGGEKKQSCLQ